MWAIAFSLAALLSVAAAQDADGSIGTCTPQQVNSFIGGLPNGEMCGWAFLGILFPYNLTDTQYATVLNTFCAVDCGAAIAKYSGITCGEPEFAVGLLLFCLPRETGTDRCRSVYPDLVGNSTVIALASCANFDTECPEGCAGALWAAVGRFGCCYQSIYNNTEIVAAFVEQELVNAFDLQVIRNISQPELWAACNMSLISVCDGEPFPGESVLVVGNCNIEQLTTFAGGRPADCQVSTAQLTSTIRSDQEEGLEGFCREGCGDTYADWYRDACQDPFVANATRFICYRTEGELGDRCFFATGDSMKGMQVLTDVKMTCVAGDFTQSCPTGCQAALQELRDQFGCCYQNFFNDTTTLDILLIEEELTYDERVFFKYVGNQQLWDTCDVPLQGRCTGDPFGAAGALQLAASSIMMSCVMLLAFVL